MNHFKESSTEKCKKKAGNERLINKKEKNHLSVTFKFVQFESDAEREKSYSMWVESLFHFTKPMNLPAETGRRIKTD